MVKSKRDDVAPIRLEFSKTEIAYLLGAIGISMKVDRLLQKDWEVFAALRDRLAVHLDLDDDITRVLGMLSPTRPQ